MKVVLFSIGFLLSCVLQAQNLPQEARFVLIDKLEGVMLRIAPSDDQRVTIGLRLADLLSEAARAEAFKENEKGCFDCKGSENLRKRSIKYYEEFYGKLQGQQRVNVALQISHLSQMLGSTDKSIKILEQIIHENPNAKAVADAQASLGEIYFKRRNFPLARSFFDKAVQVPTVNQRGLVTYRIAWCLFNEGNLNASIDILVKILRDPVLLSRSADGVAVQIDPQFQEEISRDLATFLARREGSEADIQLLLGVSPTKSRLDNLFYLATELDRAGKKAQSLKAFETYVSQQALPEQRLEGHVYLTQTYRETGRAEQALNELEKTTRLWSTISCGNEKRCAELKSRIRKTVIDWNRAEKSKPSEALAKAYTIFLDQFPNDFEMAAWSAEIAKLQNRNNEAVGLYIRAADITADAKAKENLLLNAVSVAETTKDAKLRRQAYASYGKAFPSGGKTTDVAYQSAYLNYEEAKYEESAHQFRAIALNKNEKSKEIRLKSANLSLDAMVLAKNADLLVPWAMEYIQVFPKDATEFRGVARRTALTRVAERINSAQTDADFGAARAQLLKIDMIGAIDTEKAAYHKNRLILAEKLKLFSEGRRACDDLLATPGVKPVDQQFAISRKAYFAEMVLDFPTAFQTAQKLKVEGSEEDAHVLRMGIFAELSDQDPTPYYDRIIKENKDSAQSKALALKIIRRVGGTAAVVQKYQSTMESDPDLLANLFLEAYVKTKDPKVAQLILKNERLKGTPSGLALQRTHFLTEYRELKGKLITVSLESKNDRMLSGKIKERVKSIEGLEKAAARAIQLGDWTSQVVMLTLVSQETSRFYQDLFSLPVPQGLTPEEEQQYMTLLSQQSAPYKSKADDVAAKLQEMWTRVNVGALNKDLETASPEMRSFVMNEIETLKEVAPEASKVQLQQLATAPAAAVKPLPNFKQVEEARQAVRESPLAADRLSKLMGLEKEIGRDTMAAYLEGRLQQLGGRQ